MGLRNKKQEIAEEIARIANQVDKVESADADDLESAETLANELKAQFNKLIDELRESSDF